MSNNLNEILQAHVTEIRKKFQRPKSERQQLRGLQIAKMIPRTTF